jgi:1-acyl-sn-glycerol-3-phosphate acyltransferase
MISAILMVATFIVLGIPGAIVYIPWTIITRNATPLYNAALAIARTGFRMARVRVQASGLESIPAHTACIFMANHVSNLDPPALLPHIPGRTSVFIKRELLSIPVLGYCFRLGELIPVDRDGRVQSAQQSVAAAQEVLSRGLHITTFVEGTRSPDGRMLPFKKGPFYLAKETGAPCIPVSIYGTEKLMRKGSARISPGTAHIIFHPPIYPVNFKTREDLSNAVRAAIASALPEWMRSE